MGNQQRGIEGFMKKGNTKIDLVKDLENTKPSIERDEIIQKAKIGYYHDFESELALPKTQLHLDLVKAGLFDIDKKMQNGDYDNESPSPEENKRLMDLLKKGGN